MQTLKFYAFIHSLFYQNLLSYLEYASHYLQWLPFPEERIEITAIDQDGQVTINQVSNKICLYLRHFKNPCSFS